MKKFMSFDEFINEKYAFQEKKSINEEVDYKVAKKLLDELYNQDQRVKASNYDIKEIKKLDAIEKEIVKIGLAPKLGSSWYKEKTPKELHKQYKEYGYSWLGENKAEEKDSINEFGPLAASGNKFADEIENLEKEASRKSEKGISVYVVYGKNGRPKLSKYYEKGNTIAGYYNGFPQNLDENNLDESIDSRVRSKVVVHLKNQGIEHGEDYEFLGGEFLAKDMDVAQDIADAAADKFRVVIYDDRITKDGKIPMMIVENGLAVATTVKEVPTINLTQTVENPIAKEDIKGFHKLDSIKKDIENSRVALEKMKKLIDQGVNDKKLTENYIKLLEHRTNLIKEMNTIIEQTKQTINKK